jgi:hypothetical protein
MPGVSQHTEHSRDEIGPGKLQGRNNDHDADRGLAVVPPPAALAAGFAQHPFAQPDDEPGFLGNRNELVGRYEAERRVRPARQRFISCLAIGRTGKFSLVQSRTGHPRCRGCALQVDRAHNRHHRGLGASFQARLALETDLRRALDGDVLCLH